MKMKKKFFTFSLVALVFSFFSFTQPKDSFVYLYPGYWGLKEGQEDVCMYGINLSEECKKRGLTLKVTKNLSKLKNAHKIIVFDILGYKPKVLKSYSKEKLALFLWEPPIVLPKNYLKKNHDNFSKVFTWNDSLVDNKKYFKFCYPELGTISEDCKPFSEKKLCCIITANKTSNHPAQLYSTRIEAIKFFENYVLSNFDFFGIGWEYWNFRSYRGSIPSKEVLKNYKFSLCFENGKDIPGYVTEKIFNCFQYLCVPIYLGTNNINDYVPENCFIDMRKFSSYYELLSYIQNMPEEEYLRYQRNIMDYYKSEKAKMFVPERFKEAFLKALE